MVSEDKDPTVRASFVEQIPHIFLQCHEHACPDLEHYLYDRLLQIVLDYLQDAEDKVSRDAYSALQILIDKYVLDKKRIEEKVCAAIMCPIHKIHYENLKDFNINSVTLMGRIAPIIGSEKSEELFLNHFIELCKCKINSIRKKCAAIFPTFCYVLGTKITEDKLLELFFQLCTDPFWGVRKSCAESVPLISLICSPECRRNRIAPIVLRLAKDNNTWVTSATLKILGQFISSFAQPCITGLAYSYNGELLITNPVDPDFRDISDPQTLANYEHYLKMFSNIEVLDTTNTATGISKNSNSAKNGTSNQVTNICDENLTPKNIAQIIIENKIKLTEQITEYAWPKQKFFKNYVFNECSKYIDLDTGNNNVTDNTDKNNIDRGNNEENNENLCLSKILDNKSNIESSNETGGFGGSGNENNDRQMSSSLPSETLTIKDNTVGKEQNTSSNQQMEQQSEQQQEQQTFLPDNSNKNSEDNNVYDNIIDNIIFVSENSSLENNLHRRRCRRNAYSFWRKNTPSDLQSIIKKAMHDAQDNIKPPLPPPPPHPLKLPAKSPSITTIGPSSTTNTKQDQLEDQATTIGPSSTTNTKPDQLEDQAKDMLTPKIVSDQSLIENSKQGFESSEKQENQDQQSYLSFEVLLSRMKSFITYTEEKNKNSNVYNSNDDSVMFACDDGFSPFFVTSDSGFKNRTTTLANLNDKKDKNGNEEDEAFNEFNSYKFWHISPEMPLDSNIVGNVGTWNTKILNETLPITNSSILDDDDIVRKTPKFSPPITFEQNVVPPGILEAYVTMVLYEEEDEIKLTCAYNFPAVVLTLGRSNWHILKTLLQYLCDDIDWKVRKTIALSINFLALILGKEIATRDLVPIYLGFFKDLDEVKIEAIRNFASFLKVIDKSKREEILSNIGICLRCDSRTNWRIKEDLAKEVCHVIKMYDSIENCDILLNLSSLTGYFLEDKVSCVREIAADAMAEIIRISDSKFKEAVVKHFLVDEFANSSKWRNRQTFLNVLYKYNMMKMIPILSSKNISTKVLTKTSETPLSKSSSTGSASNESSPIDCLKDVNEILHLVFPSIEKLSVDFVPNIRLLVAKYLVLLINVNAISEDLYERFLKIIRRLRIDEDCDVRETFESVDLLKDEIEDQQNLDQQSRQSEELNKTTATGTTETAAPATYSEILKSNLDNFGITENRNIEKTQENKEENISKLNTESESITEKTETSSDQQQGKAEIPDLTPLLKFVANLLGDETSEGQEPKSQPQSVESNNETDEIVKLPDAIVSQSQI
ncbi:serine/threonine-protein phosphatase 4 regulatory subunit 1-like [Condylostylus longicornis]|uniref:serine/threonine-protein phosphatase 4 regulatory subunit 1-like n=1 Tax=Condylostylus longicornis TaxID=2530218 RepID=UPI00244D9B67|nr:serine/threonine-protein phosphatase 4 regulatory subunit 1-like [Condylostylus longicornis]